MEDEVRYVERKVAVTGCEEDSDLCVNRYTEQLVAELFDEETCGACANETDGEREQACYSGSAAASKSGYSTLVARIESALRRIEGHQNVANVVRPGRIGMQSVVLDAATLVGNMHMETDRLGLVGTSDFSTVRANCAVYSGKWMYEALLGTRGVMQFGWCTLDCQFSEEKGVGDTPRSYAYDGNRLRKWNMTTERYGEPWFAGDVIGCAIDLDAASISFYRNGRALGTAFSNVPVGPGIAYFPAFSLSLSEAVRLNFGALPFMHPVPGYQPLQAAPLLEEAAASRLTAILERVLVQLLATTSQNPLLSQLAAASLGARRDDDAGARPSDRASPQPAANARALLNLAAYHVLQHANTYFTKAYHVQSCLVDLLVRFHKMCLDDSQATANTQQPPSSATFVVQPPLQAFIDLVSYMLDLFWTFLHENEVTQCLEHLLVALLTLYRYSAVPIDFGTQKRYLQIVLALLSHTRSRRFLLSHVLFDRVRFPLFLHVKPPDDVVLEQLIPQTWLVFAHKQEDLDDLRFTRKDDRKNAYMRACTALQKRLGDIQQLQTELLKLLMRDDDDEPLLPATICPATVQVNERSGGSRAIFIRKLRMFMKENYAVNTRTAHLTASQCPIPVVLCFLHHLIRAVNFYYHRLLDQVHATNAAQCTASTSPPFAPSGSRESPSARSSASASAASATASLLPPFADVYIPLNKFYDSMLSHLDVQRLGGLATYLKKTNKAEIDAFEKQRGSINAAIRIAQPQTTTTGDAHSSTKRRTVDSSQLSSSKSSNSTHPHKPNASRSLFSTFFPFASSSQNSPTATPPAPAPAPAPALTSPVPATSPSWSSLAASVGSVPMPVLGNAPVSATSSSISSTSTSSNSPSSPSTSSSSTTSHCASLQGTVAVDFDAAHSSLLEVIDSCVLLYHIGAHKQNGKMSTLRENMRDYYLAYCDTEAKLARCDPNDIELRASLEHTRSVFETKLTEDSRHMAWILAVVFVEQNRAELYWLMRVLLTTVKRARQAGHLFALLPDYYLDTLVNVYQALCNYFHPTLDVNTLENFDTTLVNFAKFLVKNANDKRIVTHDVKDKLLQALCSFVSYRFSMRALERLLPNSSDALLQLVLQVYENRSWTQTNLILIRFWKGCGWAFRYVHLPHIMPLRSQQSELMRASMEPACPSLIYQDRIKQYLLKDYDRATTLISSVLNELNWSFSEFVCLINDLHQNVNPAEHRVVILNRQLKLCATLFDLAVSLLRVVEMFVHLVPDYFLNWRQFPRAEMLLTRLYQIITQILHRVTNKGSTIIEVLQFNLPELESIDRFPILAAIVGVICQLILNHGNQKWREQALRGLINDAGIDVTSLQYLLGFDLGSSHSTTATTSECSTSTTCDSPDELMQGADDYLINSVASGYSLYADVVAAQMRTGAMNFSFRHYKEVNRREVQQLETLVHLVTVEFENPKYQKPTCHEDQLCNICYANARDATFKPCGHQSCKSCISQQMLIKKECFFCKGNIQAVIDSLTGEQLSFK